MRLFPKTTTPRKPRHLTLAEMWELSRILKGTDTVSILRDTHPGLLYHAMLMLYGDLRGITTGAHLFVCLDNGLKVNHYQTFLSVTKGQ